MGRIQLEDDEQRFRALCEQSKNRYAVADVNRLLPPGTGSAITRLSDELTSLLKGEPATGFDTHDLRRIGLTFSLEQAIGAPTEEWAVVIRAIASCLSAGTRLPDLRNPVWSRIVDLGRGLVDANLYDHPDQRTMAVAAAGARLVERGFPLEAQSGEFRFLDDAEIQATREIQTALDRLGQINVLRTIFEHLRNTDRMPYGLYMPVRSYTHDRSESSFPYGFLIHLAVRSPVFGQRNRNVSRVRHRAFSLARDLVAALNVEPYHSFDMINAAPGRVSGLLRELSLFDHLFALPQQWPPDLARMVLAEFFRWDGACDLWTQLGWSIEDALALYGSIVETRAKDPVLISRSALSGPNLRTNQVERMLPHFAHGSDAVNAGYDSPLAAKKANLLFKPLIQVKPDQYLVPAASFAGPALYEAVMTAVRNTNPSSVSGLQGRGTERVVGALLDASKLRVAARGAKYEVDGGGECDFVVESESHILFVECKAKALTRGAMAGIEGDALLDFGGGMFAAQAQAMRHERILRKHKRIEFIDGTPSLIFRERTIFRLSVTLLDQGALQDRMVLWKLYHALLSSKVTVSGDYGRQGQVDELNRTLDRMREQADALEELGVQRRVQAQNCASLSVGSLSVVLKEVASLDEFLALTASATTFVSYNPLFEMHQLRRSGIISV